MIVFDEKKQENLNKSEETIISARAVSRGVGIGKAICLTENALRVFKTQVSPHEIDHEISRFKKSISATKQKLSKIKNSKDIFDSHLMILEDPELNKRIESLIRDKKYNAEWAIKKIFDEYIKNFSAIEDQTLNERSVDLIDLKGGILKSLQGQNGILEKIPKDSVIVTKLLRPTTLIEISKANPAAVITERGGWTSHSFILTRELNIPAVTGVKNLFDQIQSGDELIVDGYSGDVFINPESKSLNKYAETEKNYNLNFQTVSQDTPVKTLDGKEIILRANLDFRKDFSKAEKLGAQGVGLFRSEYLSDRFNEFPNEEEQFQNYKKIGKAVGKNGVIIRTFDFGSEQFLEENSGIYTNPALGLRGIRLSLNNSENFRKQIRAILRASVENEIAIVLPMISSLTEIVSAKEIIDEEKNNLTKLEIKVGNPRIGAMIEVPSAVLTIENIVEEVDFVNIGTNDLVQYLLAVDRDNETVADWFRTLHPAVIKAIEMVLKAADKEGKPAIVCGEMAGSPFYAPILIGLGAKELSMNVNSLARLRKTISGIAYEETLEVIKEIKKCKYADQIDSLLRKYFSQKWSHLFSPEILPLAKKRENTKKS